MSEPLSEARRQEIRERAEKVSPWNWSVFFAHARADIPALLADGDALRAENQRLLAALGLCLGSLALVEVTANLGDVKESQEILRSAIEQVQAALGHATEG